MALEAISSSKLAADYMRLLVEQLKHQDPLEPMNNNDMTSQLTSLAQLQQLEAMNGTFGTVSKSFADIMSGVNRNYANSLLDKKITFYAEETVGSSPVLMTGTVKSVFKDADSGEYMLQVQTDAGNYYSLNINGVVQVQNQ